MLLHKKLFTLIIIALANKIVYSFQTIIDYYLVLHMNDLDIKDN